MLSFKSPTHYVAQYRPLWVNRLVIEFTNNALYPELHGGIICKDYNEALSVIERVENPVMVESRMYYNQAEFRAERTRVGSFCITMPPKKWIAIRMKMVVDTQLNEGDLPMPLLPLAMAMAANKGNPGAFTSACSPLALSTSGGGAQAMRRSTIEGKKPMRMIEMESGNVDDEYEDDAEEAEDEDDEDDDDEDEDGSEDEDEGMQGMTHRGRRGNRSTRMELRMERRRRGARGRAC